MSRSLVPKKTIEMLEVNAPEGYGVEDNLLNIDIYQEDEVNDIFEELYLPEEKTTDAEYLLKMVSAATKFTGEDLVLDGAEEEVLSVAEKLVNDHRRATVTRLDGDRVYVHYK